MDAGKAAHRDRAANVRRVRKVEARAAKVIANAGARAVLVENVVRVVVPVEIVVPAAAVDPVVIVDQAEIAAGMLESGAERDAKGVREGGRSKASRRISSSRS